MLLLRYLPSLSKEVQILISETDPFTPSLFIVIPFDDPSL